MTVGENIRRIRKKKGFSILKLREATGLSKSTISEVENNKSKPNVRTLEKIADALDVSVDRLTGEALSCIIENRLEEIGVTLQELAEKSKVPLAFLRNLDDVVPGNEIDGGEQCYSYVSAIAWILDLPASQLRAALARQEAPVYDGERFTPEEAFRDDYESNVAHSRVREELSPIRIPNEAHRIPVLGSIPAGTPVEAVEDIIGWEEIPEDWLSGDREYFALLVRGDSMYPEYIEGDVVIVRRQSACDSGDDCVVMVNDKDATLKRIHICEGGIELAALNKMYGKRKFTNEEVLSLPVTVLGVIVELRRKKK